MLLLVALLACTDKGDDTGVAVAATCEDQPDLTWANWGDWFFLNYCRSCHSAHAEDRWGAPDGVNFDTLEEVRQQSSLIEYVVLTEQSMPVGGGVYDEDLEFLKTFLECDL